MLINFLSSIGLSYPENRVTAHSRTPRTLALLTALLSLTTTMSCSRPSAQKPAPQPESTTATTQTQPAAKNDSADRLRAQALEKFDAGALEEAWKLIQRAILLDGQNSETLFVAARITAQRGKLPEAVKLLGQIPATDEKAGLPALGQAAEWLCQVGDLQGAETRLKQLLKSVPNAVAAHRLLVRIYNAQGRRWETRKHIYSLVRAGDFRQEELTMLIDLSEPFDDAEFRAAADKFNPADPFGKLSLARRFLYKNRFKDAEPLLQQANAELPTQVEPWVWLGHIFVSQERLTDLPTWLAKAPADFESHPQYWIVRGRWAELIDDQPGAARCYSEAIKRDPMLLPATQRLAAAVVGLGHTEQAELIRQRARLITDISTSAQEYLRNSAKPGAPLRIANFYRELGEPLLGIAWETIGRLNENSQQAIQNLGVELRRIAADQQPSPVDDILKSLPIDQWQLANASSPTLNEGTSPKVDSSIRIRDVAAEMGIAASYDNGGNVNKPGLLIFQGNGGGVGAIDYDRDGWIDFFFSNAGGKPAALDGHKPKSLYRSLQGKRFQDSTSGAFLGDRGYGQGIAVGDVDQDGFADLVAINFGVTRLFRNQGDGTFEEAELPQPPPDEVWCTSSAIVDIDGDTLPEIVLGAYISGTEVRTRECINPNTDAKNCQPNEFPPCPNLILANQGDGRWQRITGTLNDSISTGRSLGVCATNLDGKFGNDIFFSNDVSPNFLLMSSPSEIENRWSLTEQASRRGVAVDAGGRAQAYMGIACGDVDRNGLLDIAVTTFLNDTNTLYLQKSPGTWVDGTRRGRFNIDSLEFLGFGCQFLDVDDDGWLDFVVLNGHIDDFSQIGVPYRMVPQVFKNQNGAFYWTKDDLPGAYFQQPALGRSLAIVDFDQDHRLDLVATHLDRPAALLRNESPSPGNFIEFELVGVQCDREAIGAIVHADAEDEHWVSAITAGDGYLSSSQKLIHIGLGPKSRLDQVTIKWPSGTEQVFKNLEVNKRYFVVQGSEPVPR
jgi:tetratricopeptide (TPR) repeat protein